MKQKIKNFLFITFFSLIFFSCKSIHTPLYNVKVKSSFNSQLQKEENFIRIVQISDFHSNDFGKKEEKLIKKIVEAKPDLIVMTGDTFDFERSGIKPVQNVRYLLEGIKGLCPFFYVNGNHEFYNYHNDEYSYLIKEYRGQVLNDKAVKIKIKNLNLIIAGVQDPFFDLDIEKREKENEDTNEYKKRIKEVSYQAEKLFDEDTFASVLLAHRPEYIYSYLEADFSFDIFLSGHAHGGQWRFFGINGLYAPMQGLFPEFAGGRYDFDEEKKLIKDDNISLQKCTFIVSRGLAYQTPWIPRIFNNPELVIIDIKK